MLTLSVDDAERALIDLHKQPEMLRRIELRLHGHPALRSRLHLIRRALDNYRSEHYMETVLILLTVKDGFVAGVDRSRPRAAHQGRR